MKPSCRVTAALSIGVAALLGACESTPESKSAVHRVEDDAVMQAFLDYATPGQAHEALATRAGTWDVEMSFWPSPDAPPGVLTGVSEVTLMWDGRYVIEDMRGEVDGRAFRGHGVTAYDNFKERFVAVWMDSMSTGIVRQEGQADESGRVINYLCESPDPATRSYKIVRSVETIVDDETRTLVMYDVGDDGLEFRKMEIVYRRRAPTLVDIDLAEE